jgi:3-methyladenine DNA glycosylase AlkD
VTPPEQFARTARKRLRAVKLRNAPPEGYLGTAKYEVLGIYTIDIKQISKELLTELPENWIEALCELRAEPVYEAKVLAVNIAVRKHKSFEKGHWTQFSKWVDDCEGWALVDNLCCDLLSVFVMRWPELIEKSSTWSRSRNLWKRRSSLSLIIRPVRTGDFAAQLFERMSDLAADHDPMIHKAVSWGLRSAITTNRKEVEKFLHEYSQVLKPAVIREVRTKLDTGRKSAKTQN